jgi:hypothetical protein
MSTFEKIKEHLFRELRKKDQPLPSEIIDEEISNAKSLIENVGLGPYLAIISNSEIKKNLTPEEQFVDWIQIREEIERFFCIIVQPGTMVASPTIKDRTWWTGKAKMTSEQYYWNRYYNFLSTKLTPEVLKVLDDDTDVVMNYIGDPAQNNFNIYGMVVGHVQSGKTSNYSALIDKAADAGYKFIVVIAGSMNNLRNQTQNRMYEAFIGVKNGQQVGVGKFNSVQSLVPISLTNDTDDFKKEYADNIKHTLNFENISTPILLVIKKESNVLEGVEKWLKTQYPNGLIENHAMLMIDDESDYASINTNQQNNPTIINKKIRKILKLFNKTTYVAFTATPYANIFIDHEATNDVLGDDLFPKDFIYLLEPPTNYLGARHYFVDSNEKHIKNIDDFDEYFPLNHKIDVKIEELPKSLKDAIKCFLINISIRHHRGYTNSHNSMLIHVSRFTDVHIQITTQVTNYIRKIIASLEIKGSLPFPYDNDKNILEIKNLYENEYKLKIDFSELLPILVKISNKITIKDVHSKSKIPLEYRNEVPVNAIVIGGTSLSRGYTLEGLSVSYFSRNTILYDTLMQMGRWFGYREGYSDICKVFIPSEIEQNFKDIILATEELFEDFRELAQSNLTPYDFGLAIRMNPNSALQITARNKLKNVKEFEYNMKFDGKIKETVKFKDDKESIQNNINNGLELINNLDLNYPKSKIDTSAKLWEDVDKDIVKNFLDNFLDSSKEDPLGIISKMPLPFIKDYVKKRDCKWDIALISGAGKSSTINEISFNYVQRTFVHNSKTNIYHYPKNQLSIPSDESLPLISKGIQINEFGTDRKKMRKLRTKPLLLLYFIEGTLKDSKNNFDLLGFAISFDGDIGTNNQTTKLKINTVYYQNLLENLNSESDDEN